MKEGGREEVRRGKGGRLGREGGRGGRKWRLGREGGEGGREGRDDCYTYSNIIQYNGTTAFK